MRVNLDTVAFSSLSINFQKMKHAVFLFLLLVILYALWSVAKKPERSKAVQFVTKHGLRIGLILIALFIGLALAVQTRSINLF